MRIAYERFTVVALACVACLATASVSEGQAVQNFNNTSSDLARQAVGFNYTSAEIRSATFNGLGGAGNGVVTGGSPFSKPFANASRGPTVSPYLGLFNTGVIGDEIDSYQTIVRPQLEQQQLNNQFRQQANQINRAIQQQGRAAQNQAVLQEQRINAQFQQFVGQAAFNPQGSNRIMPTGHTTTFGFTGRYYPGRGPR